MQVIETGMSPIFAWTDGVEFEDTAREQLRKISTLPFIHHHIAVMPDVHMGIGATVGSVIPTKGAIVPAAVGVDIGCGMVAQRTSMLGSQLPDNLRPLRDTIERTIPVGFSVHERIPGRVETVWDSELQGGYDWLTEAYPKISSRHPANQLGTLGGGNHFWELTIDQDDHVWIVLHSGSRGIGNQIGKFFIARAKEEMERQGIGLADKDLAYLTEDTQSFKDYVRAVNWAQMYAMLNRAMMMERSLR